MEILPAIDLRDGQVVRLSQGDYDRQTTYFDEPVEVVDRFLRAGVRWMHVVDLDAARSGELRNTGAIADVCKAVGSDIRVEVGGGIRDAAAIDRLLEAGASRLVIGSAAVKNPQWFERLLSDGTVEPAQLALGLDARDGALAAEGWTEQLSASAEDFARRFAGSGLGAIVYTDIARDGMLSGVSLGSTERIVSSTDVPVIASGGVASLEDIRRCREIGCGGAIIGRAWYEGRINLVEARSAALH